MSHGDMRIPRVEESDLEEILAQAPDANEAIADYLGITPRARAADEAYRERERRAIQRRLDTTEGGLNG